MMKKLLMALSATLSLMLSSCIEHHVVLSVNKDGSGTITEETTMGGAALGMMGGMLGAEGGGNPMADLVDEDEAKAKAASMGEGVTLDKIEEVDADGRKGGKAIYAFKDINKLKYTYGDALDEMGEGMAEEAGEEAAENEPIVFAFKDGILTVKNGAAPEAQLDEEAAEEAPEDEMDEAAMAMAKQMMGDMKMSFKIEIPGGIEESNATHVDGNTITMMEMHMGKLLEDPENFKKLNEDKPGNAADMQEALKGIEGVKVESKEEITIKLK